MIINDELFWTKMHLHNKCIGILTFLKEWKKSFKNLCSILANTEKEFVGWNFEGIRTCNKAATCDEMIFQKKFN